MMPRVVFVAPNSYVLRNWLTSGLAALCRDALRVCPVLVSPFDDPTVVDPRGAVFANHRFVADRPAAGRLAAAVLKRVHLLRAHVFAQEIPYASTRMLEIARRRDKYHYAAAGIASSMPRGSRRRALVRRLIDAWAPVHAGARTLLQGLDCTGVITGSPGFLPLDWAVMTAAAHLGIPAHCIASSWDNMTTRGPLLCRPATLMLWNEVMREQAVRIHQYPRERTHVVGALPFVPYAAPITAPETDALFRALRLPAHSPYFLYVTTQLFPEYEAEDIALLLQTLARTRYAAVPLVVRRHPQVPLAPFERLSPPPARFDDAPRFADRGDTARFGMGPVRHMAALLHHATVVFGSSATTALLEAVIFDRPTVQLRWMQHARRQRPEQVRAVADALHYQHLRALDATGCRSFCDSPAALEGVLGEALGDGAPLRRRRAAAARLLAVPPLDSAPQRIVAVLRQELASVAVRRRSTRGLPPRPASAPTGPPGSPGRACA